MTSVCARRHPCFALVLFLALGVAAPCCGAGPAAARAAREWSSEVAGALAAYRAGDYAEAQRLCLAPTSDARVQRDAAVIRALSLMRMPVRGDWSEGLAQVAQLTRDDPTLADEPECLLAAGIARTNLNETGTALDALDRAVEGFTAARLSERALAALVALAAAWAQHNEWQLTPARLRVAFPAGPGEAQAVRRARIEAVRERCRALPNHEEAAAGVGLVLARCLIGAGDTPDDGLAILKEITAEPKWTAAHVEAALLLAEHLERRGQVAEALRLYERVQAEAPGASARQAAERAAGISRPQVELAVPAAVRPGEAVHVRLRARRIAALRLEVRQVDVEAWLAAPGKRGNDALLPETGSVQVSRDLQTRAASPYDWWNADALRPPLDFTAPAGAYVVLVRGTDDDGRPVIEKRLLVASGLAAVCVIGPEQVLVWAAPSAPAQPQPELTGRFWMTPALAPRTLKFTDGVARLPLPGEARVMRDKGWVCLVRGGEQLAVCRGRVPRELVMEPAIPQLLLVGGPAAPPVGESFHVSGLLLPGGRATTQPAGDALELRFQDTLEHLRATQPAPLSPAGAFAALLPITPELAGEHLRVTGSYRRRTLANLAGRLPFAVPQPAAPRFLVTCELPPWQPRRTPVLTAVVRATHPWGSAPRAASVRCTVRATRLPADTTEREPVSGGSFDYEGRLDAEGRFVLSLSPDELGVAGEPLAVELEARVTSWDGSAGSAEARTLLGPQPAHAWLTCEPSDVTVGQETRLRVGWFAPQGRIMLPPPPLELRHDGAPAGTLPLYADRDGLHTAPWRPAEPGSYEAAVTLPALETEPLSLRQTLEVSPATADSRAHTAWSCAAHFAREEERDGVRVRIKGTPAAPLLVLVEAGDPLAARSIAGKREDDLRTTGSAELFIPLDATPSWQARVSVISAAGDGSAVLATTEVLPDPERTLQLSLGAASRDVQSGATCPVKATCRGAAPAGRQAALVARLIDATSVGSTEWRPLQRPGEASPIGPRPEIVSSNQAAHAPETRPAATPEDGQPAAADDALRSAVSEGDTLWTTACDAEGVTELTVPVPRTPGAYKLLVAARAPDGQVATDATVLDARHDVSASLEVPQRMIRGDRLVIAARLESGCREPLDVAVRVDAGDKLAAESLWYEAADGQRVQVAPGETAVLSLPPRGRTWLYASVEAAQAGAGTAVAEVTVGQRRQTARAGYEVQDVPAPTAPGAGVTIRRTALAGTMVDEPPGQEHAHEHVTWQWTPIAPGDQLFTGQLVRVREEITLAETQADVRWSQRVPATCRPVTKEPRASGFIGPREPDRGDVLAFRAAELKAGAHTHEYLLAVVRPGTCVLPAPELRAGEKPIAVQVDPAEVRLTVAGGR
jgi:tetratricopeptide (TPR) repeat protein